MARRRKVFKGVVRGCVSSVFSGIEAKLASRLSAGTDTVCRIFVDVTSSGTTGVGERDASGTAIVGIDEGVGSASGPVNSGRGLATCDRGLPALDRGLAGRAGGRESPRAACGRGLAGGTGGMTCEWTADGTAGRDSSRTACGRKGGLASG